MATQANTSLPHDTHPLSSSSHQLDNTNQAIPPTQTPLDGQHLDTHTGDVTGHSLDQPPPIPQQTLQNDLNQETYIEPTTSERIADNLFLAVTLAFAALIWIMTLVSQAYVTDNLSNGTVRTAWFALILQFFLIILTTILLLNTYLPPYHVQLSAIATLVIVFSVIAVDANIYSPNTASQRALAASYLITSIIDLVWVLYWTSPPFSPLVHVVHSIGAPPAHVKGSRYGGQPNIEEGRRSAAIDLTALNANPNGSVRASGLRPYSTAGHSQRGSHTERTTSRVGSGLNQDREGSLVASGVARLSSAAGSDTQRKSGRWSLHRSKEKEKETIPGSGQAGIGTIAAQQLGRNGSPAGQEQIPPALPSGAVLARAEALFSYGGSKDDPGELEFKKGDTLEILDKSGKWWEARRADGRTGIAPSNYLRLLE